MNTFALILTVLTLGGDSNFVIDYDLTAEDCAKLAWEWSATLDEYSSVTCQEEYKA